MTVHHYGTEVEIVGGDADEGWAVVEYPEEDTGRREVPVSELKAGDGTREIFGKLLELDNPLMDYDEHLQSGSLDVQVQKNKVTIKTINEEVIYEMDLTAVARSTKDDHMVADKGGEAFYYVKLAYEQPKRLLYKRRDALLEVEA